MHVNIITKPEYCEKDKLTGALLYKSYKCLNQFDIYAPVTKEGILTFEIIASYGFDKSLYQRAYIWQCPFDIFLSETDFKRQLSDEFNYPINYQKNHQYFIFKLSLIPIKVLNNPITYHNFEKVFFTNITNPDTTTHFYFKNCNGKFYYNLEEKNRRLLEHKARVKRQLADKFFILSRQLLRLNIDGNLSNVFKKRVLEIFLQYMINFTGKEIYSILESQMAPIFKTCHDDKIYLVREILKELEPYTRV